MKKICFRGKQLSYHIAGQGKCIVLLHGYLESKEVWKEFFPYFRYYKVIMPDLPGHGQSAVYSEAHSMEFLADAVNAILENEEIQQCIVYGHSMGGYVAQAFARKYDQKVRALGLIHSTIYPDNDQKKQHRKREINLLQQGKQNQVISGMLPNLVANDTYNDHKETIEQIMKRAREFSAEGIIAVLNGMMQRPAHQPDEEVPFHLIGSDQDNFIPIEVYQKMKDNNPFITFDMIEGCGHASFLEKPRQAANCIREFLGSIQN